jgi:hypothetical protein
MTSIPAAGVSRTSTGDELLPVKHPSVVKGAGGPIVYGPLACQAPERAQSDPAGEDVRRVTDARAVRHDSDGEYAAGPVDEPGVMAGGRDPSRLVQRRSAACEEAIELAAVGNVGQ